MMTGVQFVETPEEDRAVGCYRSILARSEAMLESAHDQAWGDLTGAISDYVSQVEKLMDIEADQELARTQRETRRELLGRILANERELDALLQARMAELAESMGRARAQLRVDQAYRPRVPG